jgi:hypothetical protein
MAKTPPSKAPKNYKVGKGLPPMETRWKPGQSGNPKGRGKGRKNIATLFHEEMNKKVAVVENGQRRMITKAQAAIKQLINSATKGDQKAIQAIMGFSKELGELKLPISATQPVVRTKRFTLRVFEKDITGRRFEVEPGTRRRITGKPVIWNDDPSVPLLELEPEEDDHN